MDEIIPCAARDQEVFRRVWQRVMAGRDDGECPVEAMPDGMEGDLPCACLEELSARRGGGSRPEAGPEEIAGTAPEYIAERPALHGGGDRMGRDGTMTAGEMADESARMARERAGRENGEQAQEESMAGQTAEDAAAERPAPEPEDGQGPGPDPLPGEDGPHRENDLPSLWEAPAETPERTARLRRQVMEALEGWQFYRHLARRARGGDARLLNALAAGAHRAARKLSAAYFLLTGLRYWPCELLAAPVIPSYWGALRARHQIEQRQENDCRMAGDDWDDPELVRLYQELAEDCQERCRQLRGLLERDHMA